jgi:hypothetical protein
MTAPSSSRDDATLRGAVVLIVAIVIGLALLARGGGGGEDETSTDATTESTESTTTVAGGDSTTVPIQSSTTVTSTPTGETRPPAEITVAVLNATEEGGWARTNADTLASAQYQTVAGNVPQANNTDTSMIYATPEAQADAQAVASLLGLEGAPVDVKPAEPLAEDGSDAPADIVVVLGTDSVG